MKTTINGFEITINARYTRHHERVNKGDTHDAVLMFILWLTEAGNQYDAYGLPTLADDARAAADALRKAIGDE